MIKAIQVVDLNRAQSITGGYDHTFTCWISAADPVNRREMNIISSRLAVRGIPHHVRYFLDFDDTAPTADFHGPQIEDIKEIRAVFSELHKSNKEQNIAINCSAGISRSTALAIIGWQEAGFNAEVALDKVLAVRRFAWPNERILRLYDTLAGSSSAETIKAWKAHQKGIIV